MCASICTHSTYTHTQKYPPTHPPTKTHTLYTGIVLFYLMRMEPFTRLYRALQGGRFDVADRLFHNMSSTWDNALEVCLCLCICMCVCHVVMLYMYCICTTHKTVTIPLLFPPTHPPTTLCPSPPHTHTIGVLLIINYHARTEYE